MSKRLSGRIVYDLKDIGRKYNGQQRKFNIAAVVALINGNQVQELVKTGDLYGYLGHGVREEWGMMPSETVLSPDLKTYIPIDPAIRTTYIKAFPDGRVEHEAEFLSNPMGNKAWEWHSAKIGGFSSVILPNQSAPTDFLGFDYVRNPNYAQNKGYVLDSLDPSKMTNRQKDEWIKNREIERKAVFDCIKMKLGERFTGFQANLIVERSMKEAAQLERDSMLAVMDNMQSQLAQLTADNQELKTLQKNQEAFDGAFMRLNVNDGNWLEKFTSDSVLDSMKSLAEKVKFSPDGNGDSNYESPLGK